MKSDGSIIIDTKILDDGMEKGFEALKNGMDSVGVTAEKVGEAIKLSFSEADMTKPIANAVDKVRELEQRLSNITTELNDSKKYGTDTEVNQLLSKQATAYDQLQNARKRLTRTIAQEARKAAEAERKEAERTTRIQKKEAEKQAKAAMKPIKRFGTRLGSIVSGALLFNLISSGLREVTKYYGKALKSNEEFTRSFGQLKGALLTAFQPIYEVVAPAIAKLMDVLTAAIHVIGQFFASLSGKSYADISKNAEALYDEANAINGVGIAAKKAQKQLAGFDQISKLGSKEDESGNGSSNIAANFEKFDTGAYKTQLDELVAYLGMSLLAVGAILAFSGINIPLGIGLMAVGAAGLAAEIALNWDSLKNSLQGTAGGIVAALSGAFLALGAILAFTGANIPLGIGLMAVGAIGLATAIAANWNAIIDALKGPIGEVVSLVSGASLALGTILAFSGANIPLGIGLMVAGAAGLAAEIALNWDGLKTMLQGKVGGIVAIVSGSLLALGAILAFSGAALPLGIALMAVGAIGLAAPIVANWNTIKEKLQGPVGKVVAIVSGALLALGAILAFTGVGIPLGIGLMAAGAVGLAGVAALNWNTVSDKLKSILAGILAIISGAGIVLGLLLCLSGVGIGLGLALIFAGLAGTKAAWNISDNPLTRFVKNLANGIINIINDIIGAVNSLFHIKFKGLNIGGVQVIPSIDTRLINLPKIPLLAQGAVIPPNAPFMAVLGDQKNGTNIEAPLSTIQEAVAMVMQDQTAAIMAGFASSVEVQREILQAVLGIQIGDDVIATAYDRYRTKLAVQRGG